MKPKSNQVDTDKYDEREIGTPRIVVGLDPTPKDTCYIITISAWRNDIRIGEVGLKTRNGLTNRIPFKVKENTGD